jgi:hypothetical protein
LRAFGFILPPPTELFFECINAEVDHGGATVWAGAWTLAGFEAAHEFDLFGGGEHLPGFDGGTFADAGNQAGFNFAGEGGFVLFEILYDHTHSTGRVYFT